MQMFLPKEFLQSEAEKAKKKDSELMEPMPDEQCTPVSSCLTLWLVPICPLPAGRANASRIPSPA
jgi:hypothetical protein